MNQDNKAALRAKVETQLNNMVEQIMKEGGKLDRLLKSGAIDLSEPEQGYVTSSRIMCALGRYMEEQHTPNGDLREHKREVKNMELMM